MGENLAPLQPGLDYHSFANIEQFRVTHLDLDLHVESSVQELGGVVGLQIKRLDPGATELILDTRDINVVEVTQKAQDVLGATSKGDSTWIGRPFHFERKDPILGAALVIELPPSKRPTEYIRIEYQASPTASALQWLTPKQTKHKAFLYTDSEPIGARSWIPLQDTPQARVTYKAIIHTSPGEVAVMGAKSDLSVKRNGAYAFEMTEAIPPYLIALAVGDIKFQQTGPRTGVYAQKYILKQAAKEFADVESMIQAGEKLFGPYRWERYDILVLPPSFPEGGMENPRLSFITPTVITGDKSLVSLIAHELAHSWSGNLVGNATWRDVWLNEGFSDYLESRIVNAVYGERREMMDRVLGLKSLRETLAVLKPADQALAIDLRDRNPAEAFSEVPYEKGRLFLTYLDAKFGRERFDAFLRAYFDHFEFKSIDTEDFLQYLKENLLDRYPGVVTMDQATGLGPWPRPPAGCRAPGDRRLRSGRCRAFGLVGGRPGGADPGDAKLGHAAVDVFPRGYAGNAQFGANGGSRPELQIYPDRQRADRPKLAHAGGPQSLPARLFPARGLPANRRPHQAHRTPVPGDDEDAGRRGSGRARLQAGPARVSPRGRRGDRCDSQAVRRGRGQR